MKIPKVSLTRGPERVPFQKKVTLSKMLFTQEKKTLKGYNLSDETGLTCLLRKLFIIQRGNRLINTTKEDVFLNCTNNYKSTFCNVITFLYWVEVKIM